MIEILFGVWTPAAIVSAIVAGLGLGYTMVGAIIRSPLYSSGLASARQYGQLVTGATAVGGAVFWVGQVVGAIADGDPLWWRILSRFTIWLLYALFLGVGAAYSFRRDQIERSAKARERARRELGKR